MNTAFLFGLISSLHCMGMCGPIAMMLPINHHNPTKKAIRIMVYHFGRITAYALLGLLFGLLGRGLYLAGFQQKLSIVMGLLMIVTVLLPEKTVAQYNFSKPVLRLLSGIKSALGAQFKKKTVSSLFTIGLLNGFLPCGLVYVALFGAIAMQDITSGVFYMILYGLGTIPMMSAVVYATKLLTYPVRNKIKSIVPLTVCCMGVLFVLRGLGLDIPFVSPGNLQLFVQSTPHCR
jgi:uncharacterized protein